jgi:hypothetical protein
MFLFVLVLPLQANAHCAGKHTGNHAHCTGGEDPPPSDANPVLVARDIGFEERIVAMDSDGGNLTEIARDDIKSNSQWSPGGTFVTWRSGQYCAGDKYGWRMAPFDRVSGDWGTHTQLACLDAVRWDNTALHFQVIPTLYPDPDENTVQILLISAFCHPEVCTKDRGLSADPFSLDSAGIHITAAFTPSSPTVATVATLQLVPTTRNEWGQNIGLHGLALSRNASWLVYSPGDPNDDPDDTLPGDSLFSFAIRPFNTSAITADVTGIDPGSVTGDIAVEVFSTDIGIAGAMEENDFAEHAEETFVFSADGQVYCVDFSHVNDPAAKLPLGPDDIEIINLTAGILPATASADGPTWRPDGSGVAFGATLDVGTTKSQKVIAEIVFETPNSMGCPDTPTTSNSTFNVIAGGGNGKRSSSLIQPDYRRNAL